jgi:plasmid maintenance system antidote protein VapI
MPTQTRFTAILHGQRAITTDTALRLARLFGTSAQVWLNLQMKFDLETAEDQLAEIVIRDVTRSHKPPLRYPPRPFAALLPQCAAPDAP